MTKTNQSPPALQMEIRRQKSLALAMGLHRRLGVDSIVSNLDPELLQMIFVVGELA
jgi:hypothetical protein